jgi:hypothetical protein
MKGTFDKEILGKSPRPLFECKNCNYFFDKYPNHIYCVVIPQRKRYLQIYDNGIPRAFSPRWERKHMRRAESMSNKKRNLRYRMVRMERKIQKKEVAVAGLEAMMKARGR